MTENSHVAAEMLQLKQRLDHMEEKCAMLQETNKFLVEQNKHLLSLLHANSVRPEAYEPKRTRGTKGESSGSDSSEEEARETASDRCSRRRGMYGMPFMLS